MPLSATAIDLFSGVGGLSLGFHQAGFDVVRAFDAEQRHVETYCRNFGDRGSVMDLGKASGDELLDMCDLRPGDVDVVFGGPPCQGFSYGGRRNPYDSRNRLLLHFIRLVAEIRPRLFVMENVAGLLSSIGESKLKRLLERAHEAGYNVRYPVQILDASRYGVPQRRHRVFVIGAKRGCRLPRYPTPSHGQRRPSPTVAEAISDLPIIEDHDYLFESDGYAGKLGAPTAYSLSLRRAPPSMISGSSTVLTGCLRTRHSPAVIRRFRRTPPGSQEPISRYYRLHPDRLAPTLRAGTNVDYGKHTAPRPIHYSVPRCITVREAARLHGFPDWFEFHPARWHAFRQIGNSVPVPLAKAVACAIASAMT